MILVIDCGSSKSPYIEECVDEFMDVKLVRLTDFTETLLKEAKGIIISGAPILLTEINPEKYLEQFSWIKSTKLPVLGICFGHQIIGLLHNAAVSKQKEDRDWNVIESLEDAPLFHRLPKEFEMMEDHCETVSIPKDFIHLAVSDSCINESMKHKEKTIYGVQFHPEVSGGMGRILIENFTRICEQHQP